MKYQIRTAIRNHRAAASRSAGISQQRSKSPLSPRLKRSYALALPLLFLPLVAPPAEAQVQLRGVAIQSGAFGSDITDNLRAGDAVAWFSGTIKNDYSYDVDVSYTIKLDGNTIDSDTRTVWGGYLTTLFNEVSPARVLQAGSHTLSLVSGTAHFDRSFIVSAGNQSPANLLLSSTNVPENLPVGTTVGTFSTVDPNSGDTFTYALVNGPGSADNASFAITGSTLKTAASFNYEAKGTYSIRALTTDQGGLSYSKEFIIAVTDVPEAPPLMQKPEIRPGGAVVLRWSSISNHNYSVHYSTNLLNGFSVLQGNLLATPPVNTFTNAVGTVQQRFWRISTEP